jgi:hypothetical protein
MPDKTEEEEAPERLIFGDDHLLKASVYFLCWICSEEHNIEIMFHPIVGGCALRKTKPIVFPCGRKSVMLIGVSDGTSGVH